jgi:hypothetical protein
LGILRVARPRREDVEDVAPLAIADGRSDKVDVPEASFRFEDLDEAGASPERPTSRTLSA